MSAFMEQVTSGLGAGLEADEIEPGRLLRGDKEHTYCFICARTYFLRIFNRCPRCGSDSVQHYSSDDLNLLRHG